MGINVDNKCTVPSSVSYYILECGCSVKPQIHIRLTIDTARVSSGSTRHSTCIIRQYTTQHVYHQTVHDTTRVSSASTPQIVQNTANRNQ
jgi:hypothetical protein